MRTRTRFKISAVKRRQSQHQTPPQTHHIRRRIQGLKRHSPLRLRHHHNRNRNRSTPSPRPPNPAASNLSAPILMSKRFSTSLQRRLKLSGVSATPTIPIRSALASHSRHISGSSPLPATTRNSSSPFLDNSLNKPRKTGQHHHQHKQRMESITLARTSTFYSGHSTRLPHRRTDDPPRLHTLPIPTPRLLYSRISQPTSYMARSRNHTQPSHTI